MKTFNTPGPWYVTEYAILAHNGGTHILEHPKLKWEKLDSITGSRGNIICKMLAECEANARLIAAAPELLELVEQAFDTFTDNHFMPPNHELNMWLEKAKAIFLATGENLDH